MRKTTITIAFGFVLIALSLFIVYRSGLDFASLSVAVTLFWIGAFLILVSKMARKVTRAFEPEK